VRPDLVQTGIDQLRSQAEELRGNGSAWLTQRVGAVGEMLGRAREAVGLGASQTAVQVPAEPPPPPLKRFMVWADAKGNLLRGEVPGLAHDEFVAALRQSQGQDRVRLARLAELRFTQEVEPLVIEASGRVLPFLEEVATGRAAVSGITEGFSDLTSAAPNPQATVEAASHLLGERYARLYREQVLRPDQTVPALRAAAGRVISAVRVDLIRSCDRYDQAFQSFLRANVRGVETLSVDGHWSAVEWAADGGSFRSLCQTLRMAEAGGAWFDEALMRSAVEPSMALHELTRELARPAAEVTGHMVSSYGGVVSTLTGWGLPAGLAGGPATLWSYAAASPGLMSHLLGFAFPTELRVRFETAVKDATRAGMAEALRGMNEGLAKFVDAELASVDSAVTARVERPRGTL
ncbi:MAG: hypothetical protein K2X44_06265, partial [Magnetospirillum sp.]|nr:hypothetical protein [Magnetospirillum sp.]